jgi:hypothetical protein
MTIICAWCNKVKRSDDDPGEVSHGICPSCMEKVLAESGINKDSESRRERQWTMRGGQASSRDCSLAWRQE